MRCGRGGGEEKIRVEGAYVCGGKRRGCEGYDGSMLVAKMRCVCAQSEAHSFISYESIRATKIVQKIGNSERKRKEMEMEMEIQFDRRNSCDKRGTLQSRAMRP